MSKSDNLDSESDNFENYLYGIAKVYPVLVPFAGIFYSLLGENTLGFMIAFLSLFENVLNIFVFKNISRQLYERWYLSDKDDFTNKNKNLGCHSELLRPSTYHPQKTQCCIFYDCQSVETNINADSETCLKTNHIGMPSGHAQQATSMTLIMILIILAQKGSVGYKIVSTMFLISLAFWVMSSRVLIGCHTLNQVLIGSVIGYFLGIGYYYILRKTNPDEIEELPQIWQYILWIGMPVIYLLIFIYSNYVVN